MGRVLCGPSWHGPSWFWAELSVIRFKAPRESYIETLGVLTFFLNMCAMVYD